MNKIVAVTAPGKHGGLLRAIALLTAVSLVTCLGGCTDRQQAGAREPDPVGGPPLLRRLTESQYRATVSDVFGSEIPVIARFERGLRAEGLIAVGTSEAGISAFGIEQYEAGARGVAGAILDESRREQFLPCSPASPASFDAGCARAFITDYGPLLFRRPLSDAQLNRYLEAAELGTEKLGSFYDGLEYALAGMMTSPQFLLRIERSRPDPNRPGLDVLDAYSKAERLSFFLTDAAPDRELLRAARDGDLDTPAGLVVQVDRLIESPRFERALRAFFADMLEFDLFEDLAKDSEIYPAFNSDVLTDAQEQTLRDIVQHLLQRQGDYRNLFTLEETFMTRALGVIYRQPVPTRNGWARVPLSHDGTRLGIQSHVSFLALHSHPGRSSPTLRGEAVRNVFLCQEVPDPPADIDFSVVQNPSKTNMPTARDRLRAHNTEPACAGCHKLMDPLGLALENYDGLGQFRTRENDTSIDSSGFLDGVAYDDAAGLAKALRDHPETPRCVVEKLYRYAVGRDTVWDERAYMDYLIAAFAETGYRIPQLMRTIALSANFFAISGPAGEREPLALTDLEEDRNPS